MYFLVDAKHKVLFGWSAKCGCSHIKRIFWFLQNNTIDNSIHTCHDLRKIPDDIVNYTTIIIGRNPYKRIVSGFLDKYRIPGEKIEGQFRKWWKYDTITFSMFVDELINLEYDYLSPETIDALNIIILHHNCQKRLMKKF